MKIDFFAEVMIKPRTDESFSIASRCSLKSLHGRGVENVRAGIRPIEGKKANPVFPIFR